jgi:hypothetical protein
VNHIERIDNTSSHGIIGLGPYNGSRIATTLNPPGSNSTTGDPPLDRIFQMNSSTEPILTVLLDRAREISEHKVQGAITIGEVAQGYEKILEQPKLDIVRSSAHWIAPLDGVTGPHGPIDSVNGTVALFDSGSALSNSCR